MREKGFPSFPKKIRTILLNGQDNDNDPDAETIGVLVELLCNLAERAAALLGNELRNSFLMW